MPNEMNNEQDKNLAILATHMEHLVKDVTGLIADVKMIPDKMAQTYLSKTEFEEYRKEQQELRLGVKELITKIDAGKFVGEEKLKGYVSQDQFWPFKAGLVTVTTAVVLGIIKLAFDFLSRITVN